jgi:hypothetical protein
MRDLDARRAPLLQSYRWAHCATARRVVARQRRGCEARWAFARPLCRNPCLPRRYDGLASFVKFVCDRPYLGGWLLPQRRSYFVLKLAHDWCVERTLLRRDTRRCKMPLYDAICGAPHSVKRMHRGTTDTVVVAPAWTCARFSDSGARARVRQAGSHSCR